MVFSSTLPPETITYVMPETLDLTWAQSGDGWTSSLMARGVMKNAVGQQRQFDAEIGLAFQQSVAGAAIGDAGQIGSLQMMANILVPAEEPSVGLSLSYVLPGSDYTFTRTAPEKATLTIIGFGIGGTINGVKSYGQLAQGAGQAPPQPFTNATGTATMQPSKLAPNTQRVMATITGTLVDNA